MNGHVVQNASAVSGETPADGGERLIFHHLVRVDDALTAFHRERAYVTVCGQVLRTGSLPSSRCPCADREEGCCCGEVVVYCKACLRDAAQANAEWGVPGE